MTYRWTHLVSDDNLTGVLKQRCVEVWISHSVLLGVFILNNIHWVGFPCSTAAMAMLCTFSCKRV